MLDQAVFAYRRLICALDDRVIPSHLPNAPTFTHRDHLKSQPRYFSWVGSSMPLDQLIAPHEDKLLRHVAFNLNFSFALEGYPHSPMTATSSSHNPVLLRRILDPLASTDMPTAELGIKLATWTLHNIKLPTEVKRQIKGAMDTARKCHPSLP